MNKNYFLFSLIAIFPLFLITNANADDVDDLQALLNQQGFVHITNGTYDIDRPLIIPADTVVMADKNARFELQDGYGTKPFLIFDGKDSRHSCWEGGFVYADDWQNNLEWAGVELRSDGVTDGLAYSCVEKLTLNRPHTGVRVNATNGGWINSNDFELDMNAFVIMVDQTHVCSTCGHSGNHYEDVNGQSGPHSRVGLKNGVGSNLYTNFMVWDTFLANATFVSANFTTRAEDNVIIRGSLTGTNYDDQGVRTIVIDDYQGVSSQEMAVRDLNAKDGTINFMFDNTRSFQVAETFTKTVNSGFVVQRSDGGVPSITLYNLDANEKNENIGNIIFQGKDDSGTTRNMGFFGCRVGDPTTNSTDLECYFTPMENGTRTDFIQINNDGESDINFLRDLDFGSNATINFEETVDSTEVVEPEGCLVVYVEDEPKCISYYPYPPP